MTWAQILGGPHGGPLPTPVVDDLAVQTVQSGQTITITGTGFTPGSQIILEPGGIVIGEVSPVDPTTVEVTIPYGLPNVKHKLYISNGNDSNSIDLFVTRTVFIASAPGTIAAASIGEMN